MIHVRFTFFNRRPITIAVQLSAMTLTNLIVGLWLAIDALSSQLIKFRKNGSFSAITAVNLTSAGANKKKETFSIQISNF